MKIVPPVQGKQLITTNAGELVRARLFSQNMVLGIIADIDTKQAGSDKIMICLDGVAQGPRFIPITQNDEKVAISFGTDFHFDIGFAETAVANWENSFDTNGALLVGSDVTLLRVAPLSDNGSSSIYYDVISGKVVDKGEKQMEQFALLAWDIRLSRSVDPDQLRPPIFRFQSQRGKTVIVFFSYSHADEGLRDHLEKHLSMLKRQGVIKAWHDRRIPVGSHVDRSI